MNPGPLNALTIDVEDWFQVAAFFDRIERQTWHGLESRVERNTERLLGLLEPRGIKATFFVLGWVAERVPELVRRIAAAGHEIACHGYSHELVYRQTPAVFREETRRAKGLLEDILGSRVQGYRASTYSVTRASLWALDIIAEEGFGYDSSLFPVRHPQYGLPEAPRRPGWIQTPAGHSLLEFPLSTAPFGPLRVPVAGGGYFRLLPYGFTRMGLKRINRLDRAPFIFYLHPWEVDPGQPRVAGASLTSRLRHYTNLSRCEARLVRLLGEFRFGTVRDSLAEHGLSVDRPPARGAPGLASFVIARGTA